MACCPRVEIPAQKLQTAGATLCKATELRHALRSRKSADSFGNGHRDIAMDGFFAPGGVSGTGSSPYDTYDTHLLIENRDLLINSYGVASNMRTRVPSSCFSSPGTVGQAVG